MTSLHPIGAGRQRTPSTELLLGCGGWRAGLCAAMALLSSGTALAQVLINPVVVELGGRQRAVAIRVTLSDKARAPMRLQADLLRWEQNLQGQAVTEPSDDLLVTPPIADLQPGATQVFRVAVRGARRSPDELSYRLILENVGEPLAGTTDASGVQINFRMRYDLPVLVAPSGPVVNVLRWKPCLSESTQALASATSSAKPPIVRDTKACIRLLNAGNRRVKVETLTLVGDGWQQALSLEAGENVLAGAEREWRVPLARGQSGAVRVVQVQTARGDILQAEPGRF